MKRAIAISFLVLFVLVGFACKSDVIVKSSSDIRGAYKGEYKVVRNTASGTQTKRARITWTFTDLEYRYTVEEMIQGNEICESTGEYTLGQRVTLTQKTYTPCVGVEEDVPFGDFSLQRITIPDLGLDSLYLLQIDTDPDTGFTKELFLGPDTSTTN